MIYLLILLQQLIASTTHLVAKNVAVTLHPANIVLVRSLLSCAAYLAWFLIRRSRVIKVERRDIPSFLLLGMLNIVVNQLLFMWGIHFTTAPNAALAYALSPLFVLIIGILFYRDRPDRWRTIGIVMAITGAAIVLLERGLTADYTHALGNVMVLAASASWAAFSVLGRQLAVRYGAVYTTGLSFFAGTLLYLPLWAIIPVDDSLGLLFTEHSTALWLQLLFLGVITSGVGYGLWLIALARLDSPRVAVFNNLQPALTTVMAWLAFGTIPGIGFITGGLLALAGVSLTQRSAFITRR